VVGLLLAAGAGRRMGEPKALVRGPDGTAWVVRAARALRAAGCDPVRVVVGAAADEVVAALAGDPTDESADGTVDAVVAADWAEGMGASLRAGIDGLGALAPSAQAALVHLVDLPDVGADVLARVASRAAPAVLARAVYGGTVGHPVLLGRDHWPGVAAAAHGDAGARDYLAGREVVAVECGDLASGVDVDSR
jgi:CTP:molybdopterin cytidylyltransferase MocA